MILSILSRSLREVTTEPPPPLFPLLWLEGGLLSTGPVPVLPFPKKLPRLDDGCYCRVARTPFSYVSLGSIFPVWLTPETLPRSLPSFSALTFLILEFPRTLSRTEAVRRLRLDFLAGELSTFVDDGCFGICDRPMIEVGFFSEGKYFLI